MKTHQLTLATLLLTFFLTSNLKAQIIDSLKIIPTNPTTMDTVKVISYTSFSSSPCSLGSPSVNIVDTNITIYTSFNTGIAPAFCYSIDTLTIGILNVEIYELHYHIADTAPPTTYDIDTIIFIVQQPSGLQLIDYSDQRIKVYPNPFSTSTTIFMDDKLLTSPIEIIIYDIFGREIKRMTKIKNKEITITRDNLIGRLYFIRVIREDKIIDNRKIIIE